MFFKKFDNTIVELKINQRAFAAKPTWPPIICIVCLCKLTSLLNAVNDKQTKYHDQQHKKKHQNWKTATHNYNPNRNKLWTDGILSLQCGRGKTWGGRVCWFERKKIEGEFEGIPRGFLSERKGKDIPCRGAADGKGSGTERGGGAELSFCVSGTPPSFQGCKVFITVDAENTPPPTGGSPGLSKVPSF